MHLLKVNVLKLMRNINLCKYGMSLKIRSRKTQIGITLTTVSKLT